MFSLQLIRKPLKQAVLQNLVQMRDRQDFACNSLLLIVPADSKATIRKLDDLIQAGVKRVAIGNPASVPARRYAQHALETAKLGAP